MAGHAAGERSQEWAGLPSTSTVHRPQTPEPQPGLAPGQPQVVAQHPEQWLVPWRGDVVSSTVDGRRHRGLSFVSAATAALYLHKKTAMLTPTTIVCKKPSANCAGTVTPAKRGDLVNERRLGNR